MLLKINYLLPTDDCIFLKLAFYIILYNFLILESNESKFVFLQFNISRSNEKIGSIKKKMYKSPYQDYWCKKTITLPLKRGKKFSKLCT